MMHRTIQPSGCTVRQCHSCAHLRLLAVLRLADLRLADKPRTYASPRASLPRLLRCSSQLIYACAGAGLIITPFNIRWSANELHHAIVDSDVSVVAVLEAEFVAPVVALLGSALDGAVRFLLGPSADIRLPLDEVCAERRGWRLVSTREKCVRFGSGQNVRPWESLVESCEQETSWASNSVVSDERMSNGDGCSASADVLAEGAGRANSADQTAEDVFCIVYTSGSTGRSKAVMLTHLSQVR